MNYLAIIGILTFFITFFISVYIWLNKKIDFINISVSIFTINLSLWGLSLYFATTSSDYYLAYNWYMLFSNIALLSTAFLINVVLLIIGGKIKLRQIYFAYLPACILIFISRFYPSFYITTLNSIDVFGHSFLFPKGGILYYVATAVYIIQVFYAILLLNYHVKSKIKNTEKLKILKGLNISFILGFIPSIFFYLTICYYFFSPLILATVPCAIILGLYFFLKLNMKNLDIEWGYTATKILYLVIFFTVAITILYLVYLKLVLLFVLIVFIILVFPFFLSWVRKNTKENLYKTKYAYLNELSLLSEEIENSNIFSKKDVVRTSFERLGTILNINSMVLFVKNNLDDIGYKSIPLNNFSLPNVEKKIGLINNKSSLITLLKLKKMYLLKQELLNYGEIESFQMMSDLNASFVFPVFIGENLYALLLLGDKINKKTLLLNEDIRVIQNVIKSTEKTLVRAEQIQQYSEKNKLNNPSNIEFIATVKRLIKTKNILELANNFVNLLSRNLKIKHSAFYVYSEIEEKYLNVLSPSETFQKQSDFIKILHAKEEILYFDQIKEMAEKDSREYYLVLKNTMQTLSAHLIVPIVLNNLIGFIVLGEKEEGYSASDLFKINFIAHALAMTLEDIVYKNNFHTEETEIYDQKYFDNLLEEAIIRSFKTQKQLSLMFVLSDNLLVKNLKQLIRVSDILSKYSETEFVVILPETGNEIAHKVALRIKKIDANVKIGVATLNYEQYKDSNIEMLDSIKEKFINEAYLGLRTQK